MVADPLNQLRPLALYNDTAPEAEFPKAAKPVPSEAIAAKEIILGVVLIVQSAPLGLVMIPLVVAES